jgi:hypothetical protein
MIEDEIQAKITEVKQELQWESEKKSIALAKLRKKFLDPLEVKCKCFCRSCLYKIHWSPISGIFL